MTTILLARHGQTQWNAENRWQGHADIPLDDTGREQAGALAASLAGAGIGAIWSSDLVRARETAEIVGAHLGLGVEVDRRLREVDVGEWSGLTTSEIEERYPDGLARRRAGGTGWESGEDYEAMGARVVAALQAIAAAHPGETVLVVSHGGPITSTWLACGGGLEHWRRRANCDLDQIVIRDGQMQWIHSTRGGLHQQVQG